MCVLGLGLIGGSLLRAARGAGREVFGYNRSIDGVQAARFDGFDATASLTEVLERAGIDAQRIEFVLFDVTSSNQNLALIGIVEACQQLHERRFARAIASHQRDRFT